MIALFWLFCGLTLLLIGGTALVRGASGVAQSLGVPPVVIGLTVVAFGTSAPELVVTVIGALRGESDIAFGNVLGSNLANLGLVLGLAALMQPIRMEGQVVRREIPLLMLGTAVLAVLCVDPVLRGMPAVLDRSGALSLLLLFLAFIYVTVFNVRRESASDPLLIGLSTLPNSLADVGLWRDLGWMAIGILLLAVGGEVTITQASLLAERLGLASVVVGMVFVAIGTSLPELVTSIIAAMRREADLAVGNLIGSNIFNSLFVLPVSAAIVPLRVPTGGAVDVAASFFLAAVLIPIFIYRRGQLSRLMGAALILVYVAYMGVRIGVPA